MHLEIGKLTTGCQQALGFKMSVSVHVFRLYFIVRGLEESSPDIKLRSFSKPR
jgi:hypothetical protein